MPWTEKVNVACFRTVKRAQGYVCNITTVFWVKVQKRVIPMDRMWAYGGESWPGAQKDLDVALRCSCLRTRAAGWRKEGLLRGPRALTGESISYAQLPGPHWEAGLQRHSQERSSLSFSPSFLLSAMARSSLDESKSRQVTGELPFPVPHLQAWASSSGLKVKILISFLH